MHFPCAVILAAVGFSGACLAETPASSELSANIAQEGLPSTLVGGRIIHTDELIELLKDVILIDVAKQPASTPAQAALGGTQNSESHKDIPGSVWIPGVGAATIDSKQDTAFIRRLQRLTNDDPAQPIVFYGHAKYRGSLNAAKRAISLGYRSVYWYPDGVEGWQGANQMLAAPKA